MNRNILLVLLILTVNTYAKPMQEGEFVKEKQELIKLKQELDEFYKIKEKQYKKNKNELSIIDKDIQLKLDLVEKTKEDNKRILDEIKLVTVSKAMTLYGKMKIKIVKNILQEKIDEGQIDEVFDILVRLKDKRVMDLLKKFDTKISTTLMDKLKNYKKEE